jgi:succinoglycan biosynthesis transport protein ExoP
MDNLEKYLDRVIERKSDHPEGPPSYSITRSPSVQVQPETEGAGLSNTVGRIFRRWYVILLTVLVMCGVGIPAMWFLIEPMYNVTAAIRVAPILTNILSGETENFGGIQTYRSFMNTQANIIVSNTVLQRVADDLSGRNLAFFEGETGGVITKVRHWLRSLRREPDSLIILREAVFDGVINVIPSRQSELIELTMESTKPEEAEQIINAFIRNYMAVEGLSSIEGQDQELRVLEDQRRVLGEKLQNRHAEIRQLAQEYGTTALAGQQDMMLQRVTTLLGELTKLEARRVSLESQVQLLEKSADQVIGPQESLQMRSEYINSDASVQELTRNIIDLERDLLIAEQTLASGNPAIKQKRDLLNSFQARLEEKRQEAAEEFNNLVSKETDTTREQQLRSTKTELELVKTNEQRLRELVAAEDIQTKELGRTQLNIEDLQFQLSLEKELYDTVCRRIQVLEMERKRPARISVAYNANIGPIRDKRVKYSAALIFGSLAIGIMFAYIRDKADKSVWTPDDVTKRIGIRVLGTTSGTHTIKPSLFPAQIARDYQTIRANLGLLNSEGIPKKLAVTSPGVQEGKTTFAVNLATSLAKSGKKVLLIDGDLRKPDIAYMLNLPTTKKGIQDALSKGNLEKAVCSIPSSGLDVLPANSSNKADAYELLASSITAEQINKLSQQYDNVIIDTPPVLAFPDTLLWAKIADAVVLTSFAGHTSAPDLTEAKERLADINVRVMGTVLSNVRATHGYYRYGYSYRAGASRPDRPPRKGKPRLLLPLQSQTEKMNDATS